MYSHEIEEYINKNNKELTPLEFLGVINSSPQICDVYYMKESNFRIKTTDNFTIDFKMKEEKPPKKALILKKDGK